MLKIGSLFSGIGGIELGLERTGGFQVSWQCEVDPYCLHVLIEHWPNAERFADIRLLSAADVPPTDILVGGFPCQDISLAGSRKGLAGARSSLWFEFLRLIREIRPRYVLIENVPAIYYAIDQGQEVPESPIQRILLDLAGSGYDAEWHTFSAAQCGLPHYRKRCFIVAYAHRDGRETLFANLESFTSSTGHGSKLDQCGRLLEEYESRLGEPSVFGTDPGISHRLDRLAGVGNSVVPLVAQRVGECILRFDAARG